jgi:hypothetical protein
MNGVRPDLLDLAVEMARGAARRALSEVLHSGRYGPRRHGSVRASV